VGLLPASTTIAPSTRTVSKVAKIEYGCEVCCPVASTPSQELRQPHCLVVSSARANPHLAVLLFDEKRICRPNALWLVWFLLLRCGCDGGRQPPRPKCLSCAAYTTPSTSIAQRPPGHSRNLILLLQSHDDSMTGGHKAKKEKEILAG
jgi:hypothetical protein